VSTNDILDDREKIAPGRSADRTMIRSETCSTAEDSEQGGNARCDVKEKEKGARAWICLHLAVVLAEVLQPGRDMRRQ